MRWRHHSPFGEQALLASESLAGKAHPGVFPPAPVSRVVRPARSDLPQAAKLA